MQHSSASRRLSKKYECAFHDYVLSQPEWKRRKRISYDDFIKGIKGSSEAHGTQRNYIMGLAAFHMDCQDRYKSQKESGVAPVRLVILENLARNAKNSESGRLLGDISADPVYSLLTDIQAHVEEIAVSQFEKPSEPKNSREQYENDANLDMTVSNKSGFVSELRDYMLNRGPNPHNLGTADWEKGAVINERTYGLLAKLAEIKERQSVIEEFVRCAPAYPWENIDWNSIAAIARRQAA